MEGSNYCIYTAVATGEASLPEPQGTTAIYALYADLIRCFGRSQGQDLKIIS